MAEQFKGTPSQEIAKVDLRDYLLDFNRNFFTAVFEKPAVKDAIRPMVSIAIQEPEEISFDFLMESTDSLYSFRYTAQGKNSKHLSFIKNPKYTAFDSDLYDFDESLSIKVDRELEPIFAYVNNGDEVAFLQDHDAIAPAIELYQEIVESDIKVVRAHDN